MGRERESSKQKDGEKHGKCFQGSRQAAVLGNDRKSGHVVETGSEAAPKKAVLMLPTT